MQIKELLDMLEERFPNELPASPIPIEEVGVLIGQQQVVDHIKTIFMVEEDNFEDIKES